MVSIVKSIKKLLLQIHLNNKIFDIIRLMFCIGINNWGRLGFDWSW